jgi:hypothetical protein
MARQLAYLISVHQYPAHFARLVRTLNHPNAHFFVHVDRKVDQQPFQGAVKQYKNVHFCERRFTVNRKGWSQVASTLELMRMAARYNCDYYSLLSGVCYPIKPVNTIVAFFEQASEQFISYFSFTDLPAWQGKVDQFHYRDDSALAKQQPRTVDRVALLSINKLRRIWHRAQPLIRGSRWAPVPMFFGGAQWWSLSHSCVRYILDYLERSRQFVSFFQYTDSPCEIFFQTLILNSPFAAAVVGFADFQHKADPTCPHPWPPDALNLRYINWDADRWLLFDNESTPRGPAILDQRDQLALQASPALFARKLDPVHSKHLLDWIDNQLLVAPMASVTRSSNPQESVSIRPTKDILSGIINER